MLLLPAHPQAAQRWFTDCCLPAWHAVRPPLPHTLCASVAVQTRTSYACWAWMGPALCPVYVHKEMPPCELHEEVYGSKAVIDTWLRQTVNKPKGSHTVSDGVLIVHAWGCERSSIATMVAGQPRCSRNLIIATATFVRPVIQISFIASHTHLLPACCGPILRLPHAYA